MSSVNYSLNNKGVRLIGTPEAWVKTRKGKYRLNPKYKFIGKLNADFPNMIVSASDNVKPKYRGDTCNLNSVAKSQVINYFYDEKGKRNKKSVAYFVVEKRANKK